MGAREAGSARGLLHHLKRPAAAAATWGAGLEVGPGRSRCQLPPPAPPLPAFCAPQPVPAPPVCPVRLRLLRRPRARALLRARGDARAQGPGVESGSRWRPQYGLCGARPARCPRLPRLVRGPLFPPAQCSFSSLLPSPSRCPGTPFIPVFPGFPRPVELWLPQPSVLLPLLCDILSGLMCPALRFALPASPAWYALALPTRCPSARSPTTQPGVLHNRTFSASARESPPQPDIPPPSLVSPLSSVLSYPASHPSYSHLSPSSSRLEQLGKGVYWKYWVRGAGVNAGVTVSRTPRRGQPLLSTGTEL